MRTGRRERATRPQGQRPGVGQACWHLDRDLQRPESEKVDFSCARHPAGGTWLRSGQGIRTPGQTPAALLRPLGHPLSLQGLRVGGLPPPPTPGAQVRSRGCAWWDPPRAHSQVAASLQPGGHGSPRGPLRGSRAHCFLCECASPLPSGKHPCDPRTQMRVPLWGTW